MNFVFLSQVVSSCRESERSSSWSTVRSDLNWSDLIYSQIWSDLIWSDLIWSTVRSDLNWSDLIYSLIWSDLIYSQIWSELIWSDLQSDLIWSDLIWSELIWSDLIYSQIWSDLICNKTLKEDEWRLWETIGHKIRHWNLNLDIHVKLYLIILKMFLKIQLKNRKVFLFWWLVFVSVWIRAETSEVSVNKVQFLTRLALMASHQFSLEPEVRTNVVSVVVFVFWCSLWICNLIMIFLFIFLFCVYHNKTVQALPVVQLVLCNVSSRRWGRYRLRRVRFSVSGSSVNRFSDLSTRVAAICSFSTKTHRHTLSHTPRRTAQTRCEPAEWDAMGPVSSHRSTGRWSSLFSPS